MRRTAFGALKSMGLAWYAFNEILIGYHVMEYHTMIASEPDYSKFFSSDVDARCIVLCETTGAS